MEDFKCINSSSETKGIQNYKIQAELQLRNCGPGIQTEKEAVNRDSKESTRWAFWICGGEHPHCFQLCLPFPQLSTSSLCWKRDKRVWQKKMGKVCLFNIRQFMAVVGDGHTISLLYFFKEYHHHNSTLQT